MDDLRIVYESMTKSELSKEMHKLNSMLNTLMDIANSGGLGTTDMRCRKLYNNAGDHLDLLIKYYKESLGLSKHDFIGLD